MPPVPADTNLPIAAVERETGLGKDTLRVWERRYGFPTPSRDGAGNRQYSLAQVQQLKHISRLLVLGLRPHKVVGLSQAALQALLAAHTPHQPAANLSKTNEGYPAADPLLAALLDAVASNDPQALRHGLGHALLRQGLARFVTELVAPLTTAVGEAWAQGRCEVFAEHLYTEVLTSVLRHAMALLPPPPVPPGPKVLLTTAPQEPHGLGLLMVEALLALEGCTCISLGTQTPLSDIAQAAQAHRADVVALSFTNLHKATLVQASLRQLRARLPAATALWAGGACAALYQQPLAGIQTVQPLAGLAPLVAQWRSAQAHTR